MSDEHPPVGTDVARCAELIAAGGVVVIPTDTLYGLAASIAIPEAVARVLAIKGRAGDQGMPLLLASAEQASQVSEIAPCFAELGAAFWPGGLTLVVPALPSVSRSVVDARGTVALRVPGMSAARELARMAGTPLTGTSANRTGEPPPATAAEALAAVGPDVDYVLDSGRVRGRPSTIVDLTTPRPRLLRLGAVAAEEIRRIVPTLVDLRDAEPSAG